MVAQAHNRSGLHRWRAARQEHWCLVPPRRPEAERRGERRAEGRDEQELGCLRGGMCVLCKCLRWPAARAAFGVPGEHTLTHAPTTLLHAADLVHAEQL